MDVHKLENFKLNIIKEKQLTNTELAEQVENMINRVENNKNVMTQVDMMNITKNQSSIRNIFKNGHEKSRQLENHSKYEENDTDYEEDEDIKAHIIKE